MTLLTFEEHLAEMSVFHRGGLYFGAYTSQLVPIDANLFRKLVGSQLEVEGFHVCSVKDLITLSRIQDTSSQVSLSDHISDHLVRSGVWSIPQAICKVGGYLQFGFEMDVYSKTDNDGRKYSDAVTLGLEALIQPVADQYASNVVERIVPIVKPFIEDFENWNLHSDITKFHELVSIVKSLDARPYEEVMKVMSEEFERYRQAAYAVAVNNLSTIRKYLSRRLSRGTDRYSELIVSNFSIIHAIVYGEKKDLLEYGFNFPITKLEPEDGNTAPQTFLNWIQTTADGKAFAKTTTSSRAIWTQMRKAA